MAEACNNCIKEHGCFIDFFLIYFLFDIYLSLTLTLGSTRNHLLYTKTIVSNRKISHGKAKIKILQANLIVRSSIHWLCEGGSTVISFSFYTNPLMQLGC